MYCGILLGYNYPSWILSTKGSITFHTSALMRREPKMPGTLKEVDSMAKKPKST
jgi:hypothetical protein